MSCIPPGGNHAKQIPITGAPHGRRCSQPDALCAFIGSLFYPEADRQQYLYLHGDGLDGKGALLRFLYILFGPAAEALQPRANGDKFWNMKLYGKRLILFSDCEDFKFFGSPDFKCITGNDPIYFEEKGKMGFSAIPACKVIAASNYKPNITSQRSDLRRLIYIDVEPIPEGAVVAHFEKLLLEESAGIIAHCKAVYERECAPEHGPIKADMATNIAAEAEEFFISLFHRYFATADSSGYVPGHVVLTCLGKEGLRHGPHIGRLKAAWSRHFGVSTKRADDGIRYYGMKTHCSPDVGGQTC